MDSEEPNEISEDIKKLEERKDYLEGWQKGLSNTQKAAPYADSIQPLQDVPLQLVKFLGAIK